MFYSCFDQQTGLYDYFQDGRTIPVNADVPVPRMRTVGKIGVPSIEAGVELPGDAKPAGRGWHARGLIVQCGKSGLGGLDLSDKTTVVLLTCAATAAVLWLSGAMDKWENWVPGGRRGWWRRR